MAFSKYGGALNSSGATGFGVRLLNQLVEKIMSNKEQTLSIINPTRVKICLIKSKLSFQKIIYQS